MGKPGGPPPPKDLPPDCPPHAAYIKTIGNGHWDIPGTAPFPIVFEGGDGNDSVTVIGQGHQPVIVSGGKGNDSLQVEDRWTFFVDRLGPHGVVTLGVVGLVFVAIAVIAWRALGPNEQPR
ncbi:hypothetical protein DMC47_35420 [Nostoc sp. 3335mG]|nr:hypothetical protein DMC47_35420 [Nostoc sp. 3335mG]